MVSKKNILLIASFPPPIHGSAMVSQYIKDSKIIRESFSCNFVNLSTSRKMGEIGRRNYKKIFRFIGAYLKTFFLLIFNRYDICYLAITCHGYGFLKDAPFVLLCKMFCRRIVIHQHNKGMNKYVDKWPYRWLLPLVYKNTKVILLSWFLYEDISKIVKREQILICPNGIPKTQEIFNYSKRNNFVPRLLFLSNLIESKGVYVLLDACKILKDKGYDFICDFVGGETKEITRPIFETSVKERGLNEHVIYHGAKYGNEKEKFWEETDIFVQPTYEDCFPLTIVEAMQYGKVIISTYEGAVPDLVVDGVNGFICKRKDVNSLVYALEKVLEDKSLSVKMGLKGYEIYKSKYTLDIFENRMNDILHLLTVGNKS